MTTYPLATLACTIDANGISAPPYSDIYASLQATFQGIYGSDSYLDPDSQDGQMLATFAQAQNDSNQATIAAYNNFSPSTAQGIGLSSMVKINGLARLVASQSTVPVQVTGTVGTPINNGVIGDNQNLNTTWLLPALVVIPDAGVITVTATCAQQGAVTAEANTLTQILSPTLGWQSVTNADAATAGAPVEQDATLRQRQSISTSLPAQTVLDAIVANVADVPGVQRVKAYENDLGSPDLNGVPGHSFSIVVGGGDVVAIAQAIADKKGPGPGTYGTTSELVIDPLGVPNTINFFVLADVPITGTITLRALQGYVSTTGTLAAAVVAAYISTLAIGEIVYLNRLWGPANLSGDIAVTTAALTQLQLDALSATYQVSSIVISRSANIPDTTVTATYNAGATVIDVFSAADLYYGAPISIVLDNATMLNTTVVSIADNVVTVNNAVPGGRQIVIGADLYMTADVKIAFNEAAEALPANITVTPT